MPTKRKTSQAKKKSTKKSPEVPEADWKPSVSVKYQGMPSMTKREYFALEIMKAYTSNPKYARPWWWAWWFRMLKTQRFDKAAVRDADQLLETLERTESKKEIARRFSETLGKSDLSFESLIRTEIEEVPDNFRRLEDQLRKLRDRK